MTRGPAHGNRIQLNYSRAVTLFGESSQTDCRQTDARELLKLVDFDHPELSVSRQCALLGLPRSTPYYRPVPLRESTLRIMARIDAFYLEESCSGTRRMVD